MTVRRIGICTGGGDAPGLNAVIRAAVLAATRRGWEVVGLEDGYAAAFDPSRVRMLDLESVRGIGHRGGTILGTQSGGDPFVEVDVAADGTETRRDRLEEAVVGLRSLGLDALIAIGGDGSMKLAHKLATAGLDVVGVPKTIDNDLAGTVMTFGFQTAVQVATEAVDRLHTTAEAHDRVFVVELMGRYAGWIALHAGLAGGADAILIPEIPYDLAPVAAKIQERERLGREFSIVVVAEGARESGGELHTVEAAHGGRVERLGGVAAYVAEELAKRTGKVTRTVVLGHLQRGGRPVPYDRLIASRFGAAAVRLIAEEQFGVMVALDPPDVKSVSLEEATERIKTVPLHGDTVATVRAMGISLGEN